MWLRFLQALGLEESLPDARRAKQGFRASLAAILKIGADRRFLAPALAMALGSGAMFTYIAASPFVFISYYGVSPRAFAWIFGIDALGFIAASQLNLLLLKRWDPAAVLRATLGAQFAAGLVLLLTSSTQTGGMAGVLVPLFFAVSCIGLIGPNAGALAMTPFGARAGSASALMGTMHGPAGAVASGCVGLLPGTGAVPMALLITPLVALALGSLLVVGLRGNAE